MLAIRIKPDFILQVHKNQVPSPLSGLEELVFQGAYAGKTVTVTAYGFRALENCYLLSFDATLLAPLAEDVDGTLTIALGKDLGYNAPLSFAR